MTSSKTIYVPSSVGREAFADLESVVWDELAHAYGTGKVGPALSDDCAATLRRLGDTDPDALGEALHAFFSNLCHQGTIYEATAHAVPFLAAFAAGTDLSPLQTRAFGAMFASVGIAASFDAPNGSHAGSWGDGVGASTRKALRVCAGLFQRAARRNEGLRAVIDAVGAIVRNDDTPDREAAARLEELLEELEGSEE